MKNLRTVVLSSLAVAALGLPTSAFAGPSHHYHGNYYSSNSAWAVLGGILLADALLSPRYVAPAPIVREYRIGTSYEYDGAPPEYAPTYAPAYPVYAPPVVVEPVYPSAYYNPWAWAVPLALAGSYYYYNSGPYYGHHGHHGGHYSHHSGHSGHGSGHAGRPGYSSRGSGGSGYSGRGSSGGSRGGGGGSGGRGGR